MTRICNTCQGTGIVKGLHNWGSGGTREEKCWNCHEGPQPASSAAAEPDMFWDYDDPERFGHDIKDVISEYAPGDIVKIDCAKRMPTIRVRVVADGDDLAYEVIGAPQPTPTPQADIQPAPQGETNAQLDIDSNSSAPGQQRDVAGSVALGQPVGNGSDQAAGHTGAQGDKLLIVAERNIRSFLRSAVFKSESDREAALNCVDVLWEAASTPADSVLEDAARWRAFIGSARIRFFGWAGADREGNKEEKNVYGKPNGNYVHFGAEFWTIHDAKTERPDIAARLLTTYADAARKQGANHD